MVKCSTRLVVHACSSAGKLQTVQLLTASMSDPNRQSVTTHQAKGLRISANAMLGRPGVHCVAMYSLT